MCDFTTLHHNTHGYVVQCACCRYIQIGFGTTAVTYSPQEFQELRQNLRQCSEFYHDSPFPEIKCVNFQQAAPHVMIVYSPKEIMQLTELVEMATLMLEVEKTLNHHRN